MRYRNLSNREIYNFHDYVCNFPSIRIRSIISPPENIYSNFIKENHYRYYENLITDVLWLLSHYDFDDDTDMTIICDKIKFKRLKSINARWIVEPGSELNGIKFNYAYGIAVSPYGPCESRIILTEQFTHNKYGFEAFRFNYPMPIIFFG